jgi:hypothetical protein
MVEKLPTHQQFIDTTAKLSKYKDLNTATYQPKIL